ncbi:MAG: DUF2141 domain-containing protein [Sphingomonadales bacterium]|nr:DUF2141 domain-containing protein [Sphingomonadales bacterium]
MALWPLLLAAGALASSPDLGKAEGRCRAGEGGPALLVDVKGLRDRQGVIKLEVYPANDADFLADDNVLLNAGKTFRRVEQDIPASGSVVLCVRVPGPGAWSIALLHDRDSNHKFGWWSDGVGFPGYARLGMHKPKAALARVNAGGGLTRVSVTMMYRHGLGVATLRAADQGD